jgi:carbamoyl-phosphate synthase large subunit
VRSNVQFAIDPKTGRMVVIEMNPRVSRSSALASKATGYPIAKVAAKLAVGYTLDEIQNDITRETPAAFEPTIDYVVVKIPRFNFEKFPKADQTLNTSMKSVGEAMAMGRTFKEAFQKAIRSLEVGSYGLESPFGKDAGKPGYGSYTDAEKKLLDEKLRIPGPHRLWYVAEGFRAGYSVEKLFDLCKFDPWFLREIEAIVQAESNIHPENLKSLKRMGFSDRRIASLLGKKETEIRELGEKMGVQRVFKRVDTCAAEFEAFTPYMYSTFEDENEVPPTDKKKIMILGGGPNRIGQGIEFDYCCVHAVFALKAAGFETIMVNCNPETVSTDYDTSDRLYFEPLTLEDVLAIWRAEQPIGAILQFGGQTPLKLAAGLAAAGVKILGTSSDAIDIAEDRERFTKFIEECGLRQPEHGSARSREEAHAVADRIGFPVMVRPSYVLGGRAMEVIYDDEKPVLLDRFLNHATEVDVDALSDGTDVLIGGVMEHIEEAGVHSGDSACVLPPHTLSPAIVEEIERQTEIMARRLGVLGLMNVQFAIEKDVIYVLEVNPRGSRTVPFVSKATGLPLAKIASLAMAGVSFKEQNVRRAPRPRHYSVKEAVFPFGRFTGADTLLGPEMRSTGEVMGISDDHAVAFAKAQEAAGNLLPSSGTVFLSVRDSDKTVTVDLGRRLQAAGFRIVATRGTAEALQKAGVPAEPVNKVAEGSPHIVDLIKAKGISFVINTTQGKRAILDSHSIRRETLLQGIAYTTTMEGARAAVAAIEAGQRRALEVRSVQEYHAG